MRRIVRTLQSAAKSAIRPSRMLMPIAAAIMLIATGSQAANQFTTFDTTITLTSACVVGAAAPISVTYTSFGPIVTGSTTSDIKCTNSLPYSVSLDLGSSGDDSIGNGTYAYTDPVIQLDYRLKLTGTGLSSTAPVGSSVPATNNGAMYGIGNGANKTVNIGLTISAGKSGSCTVASCVNTGPARTRTLLVSW